MNCGWQVTLCDPIKHGPCLSPYINIVYCSLSAVWCTVDPILNGYVTPVFGLRRTEDTYVNKGCTVEKAHIVISSCCMRPVSLSQTVNTIVGYILSCGIVCQQNLENFSFIRHILVGLILLLLILLYPHQGSIPCSKLISFLND